MRDAYNTWAGDFAVEWPRLAEGQCDMLQTSALASMLWPANKHLDPIEAAHKAWDDPDLEIPVPD